MILAQGLNYFNGSFLTSKRILEHTYSLNSQLSYKKLCVLSFVKPVLKDFQKFRTKKTFCVQLGN